MKVVLDTNCLLISVQAYSDFFWLWKAFHYKKFVLCYTTEILNEYDEILSQYYSSAFAEQVIEAIVNAPNSESITVYYNWYLISNDPDDNKFVDCAISANANYIVSNDRHLNVLKDIKFPKVSTVTINEFQERMQNVL